ncbi:hypothetical protein BC829DRAFT_5115 [Chytridium lagenaria]|nr:hypothetical protein BC829DRAFT_5115 [Chytridium lagenaria]
MPGFLLGPFKTLKGSAFRAIFCSGGKVDPVLSLAANHAGMGSADTFFAHHDLVLWIDPNCVSYRSGSDHGPIITVWEDRMSAMHSLASTSASMLNSSAAHIPSVTISAASAYANYLPTPTTTASVTPTLPPMSLLSSPGLVSFPQKTKVVLRLPDGADAHQQQLLNAYSAASSSASSVNGSPSMQRMRGAGAQLRSSPIVVN